MKVELPDPSIQANQESLVSGGYRLTLNNIHPRPELADIVLTIKTDFPILKAIPIPFRVVKAP